MCAVQMLLLLSLVKPVRFLAALLLTSAACSCCYAMPFCHFALSYASRLMSRFCLRVVVLQTLLGKASHPKNKRDRDQAEGKQLIITSFLKMSRH